MQATEGKIIYILTLRLDAVSQAYFDGLRDKHFPNERNYLKAHLTLFHQLSDASYTFEILRGLRLDSFKMTVTNLMYLGAGVAYQVESAVLQQLHRHLSDVFADDLIPQDKQCFRPHITVQNKVTPQASKQLLEELKAGFSPFDISATGLDLWIYQGGPWAHQERFDFGT
ncbi:2'-5' RNA ligase family protein [Sphingobacterium sp. lm-10]|uniref:2'-5' RNA ligase family protein n=1 Tax=Sphingobacterium sp. lm-10 TaxID=2944904 RepID=UPI002021E13A|nr:2'-5' RNA ligase family protein [Sphingobacterium sp. lm-10]MCL7987108.1 2'-5' RNA ligase family protein [Sphingobacterium sp. lm-10]